jgi:Core histone H2A/H2B/H3/H4
VGQPGGLRWQSTALLAIQEAAEAYLVHLFEDTYPLVTEREVDLGIYVQFMLRGLLLCRGICN